MNKNKTFLAIIPARGGSKRLPRKNVLELNGKPLITYTIEAAKKSKYIDNTILTSDDDEIINTSSKLNCTVIRRPKHLAEDNSSTFDTIEHAIKSLEKSYDYIILLQPTSPLRNEKHIDEAIELLFKKEADAIISTCEVEHPVQWNMELEDNLSMSSFVEKVNTNRSQEQKKHYRLNGAIYIINTKKLLKEKSFFLKSNIYSYIMDREDSIDIDNKIDFNLASIYLKRD